MANINKRMKQNIENAKLRNADQLTALEEEKRAARKKERIRYTIMMLVYAAVYFAICYFALPISYGIHQFRIAEIMVVIVLFDPAAFPGITIGCCAANLIGPGDLYDAILGTCATAFGIYILKWWSERNGKFYVGLLLHSFFNAFMVALEFSYNINYENYSTLEMFTWIMLGEVVCAGIGGSLLYFIISRRWEDIVSETKKGEEPEFTPTTLQ